MNFIRFSTGDYFSENDGWMITKNRFGTWDVYRSLQPFRGIYICTCRTLKEAKENIIKRYEKIY